MTIASASIERPIYTWLVILGCLLGGLWGFDSIGRLEDPAFTIKNAVIVTTYPGATAEQVATEVSEPIESEIQKMGEVKTITSMNRPGYSLIEVEVKSNFDGSELPQIWTDLRNRVADAPLPEGVSTPFVNDSFGDVFGLFYAITAPGFSDAEKHDLSAFLRRELLAVDGVADVEVSGLPNEAIFVEPSMARAVNQNISPNALAAAIATADSVAQAGAVDHAPNRTIIQHPQGDDSVSDIAGLTVGVAGEVLNLIDVADVSRGRQDNPAIIIRHNGEEAFTLGVAGIETENIVAVGERVDARLAELDDEIPFGVGIQPIYQQHVVVDQAVNNFLQSLALSVAIVVVVLALAMGWRAAIVVGATLLLTVVGTVFFMDAFSIELERISLGALIIAMGMLVDNAIVVAEGMQVAMQHGRRGPEAADEATRKTQIPLLGATVIGIMAFAGIGTSDDATGEFLFSLFAVIGISLMLSWVLAITVTPYLGNKLFRQLEEGAHDAYGGPLFRAYGWMLGIALRLRWLVVLGLVVLTAFCFDAFTRLPQQFFPDSNTPLFFVHYKLPQGNSIETTSEQMKIVEDWLAEREEVVAVTTFVGQGATRFMLTYSAENQNPTYGHMIVRTHTLDEIPALKADLDRFGAEALPEGEFRSKRLVFGPGGGADIEARISGNDSEVLRKLAAEAESIIARETDGIDQMRTDWREQELVLRPIYSTDRAQAAGITRDDIAGTLLYATDGSRAGTYREEDRLIPIILREPRSSGLTLMDQVVYSASAQSFVPLEQVIDGFEFIPENTLVHRRDRQLTITVGADVADGRNVDAVQGEIRTAVEAMDLPIGYKLEWGGEYEKSTEAQAALGTKLPMSFLIMVLISILLFNALRQPLVIWLLVPMSVNGVVIGLGLTGLPFSFTALLGLLSLSGMLIKNGIVLVEEIDIMRAEGQELKPAIIRASTSRLRPVVLAAATTIFGMVPLLWDAFFVSMAVTIMGGLAFATILTLVAAPTLYYIFFRRGEIREKRARTARETAGQALPT
ncbi:efflux RND transporter permease subunit [Tropicimonas sp. IMCC6043]|uniref:efflux RND transporter permease subunit n=1 Tax=Tropicimonas sp. IMCC6043 TaxID=2510645 RepID=UPI00101DB0E1|nr:efflux RND transporter permease subunit [Tropicimonas sp. IMCC6043]RYH09323.1 efflux RND transporter permease subunit [Tropicimonas sp. IMCC6043]